MVTHLRFICVTHNWASRNVSENIRAIGQLRVSLRSWPGPKSRILIRAGSPHKPVLALAMRHGSHLTAMRKAGECEWGLQPMLGAPALLLSHPPHLGEAQLLFLTWGLRSARLGPLLAQQGTLDMLTVVTLPRPLPELCTSLGLGITR